MNSTHELLCGFEWVKKTYVWSMQLNQWTAPMTMLRSRRSHGGTPVVAKGRGSDRKSARAFGLWPRALSQSCEQGGGGSWSTKASPHLGNVLWRVWRERRRRRRRRQSMSRGAMSRGAGQQFSLDPLACHRAAHLIDRLQTHLCPTT